MSDLKSIQAQSQADANAILTNGIATIASWQTLYKEHFSSSLASITESYSKESNLQANPSLLASLEVVRHALADELQSLTSLEMYIHLLMPQMEDGNNFGVTVQMTVLKLMEECKEKLEKKLEELPSYYSKRADAIDKLNLMQTTVTETKTTSSSDTKSTGGKADEQGDESKATTSTSKEEKASGSPTMSFFRVQHVYAIDVQMYLSLQASMAYCISSFVAILDIVEKNKDKLEQPKGSSGGSNFSSMY